MRDPKMIEELGYITSTVRVYANDDYLEMDVRRVIAFLETVLESPGSAEVSADANDRCNDKESINE